MSAHPAAYWVLQRQSDAGKPHRDAPSAAAESLPTSPVPGDVLTEYPYSGDDPCGLCGTLLSRYNPNVLCFSCIDRAYDDGTAVLDKKVRRLLSRRRPKNPKYLSVDRSWFDARLIRRGRAGRSQRTSRVLR